jgi:hypothetical protein
MFAIAFHESDYLFYEGEVGNGRGIWPSPVLSVATFIKQPEGTKDIPDAAAWLANFLFREDSFDPVTRIRRGRMYNRADAYPQPHRWNVHPHPARSDEQRRDTRFGLIPKDLFTWTAWPAFQQLRGPTSRMLIALGVKDAFTLWRVVDIERIVTGEDLLTLRARSALGVLPELAIDAIPKDGRDKVIETIDKLANAAYRSGPESIVDLARGATQWSLGVWLADKHGDPELRKKDLGALIKLMEEDKGKDVAMLVGRFHSRAKPNEQERYESRPVSEQDAEFALASVGLLLRELGWAR